MDNVKVVDKFQLEYDLYDFGRVKSFGKAVNEAYLTFEEIDVARSSVTLEKKRNKRRRIIAQALGKHAERFGYYDRDFYDRNDILLDKRSDILDRYYEQVGAIYSNFSKGNLEELCKLLSFVQAKNRLFIYSAREDRWELAASYAGEDYERKVPLEESKAFSEWFSKALEVASYSEKVVKNKK